MIYITGDTHIPIDIAKLNTKSFPEQKELTKSDYVIICGDFGGVWDNGKEDLHWRKWLNEKNFTTLFIDGNHENFDLLNEFEVVDFCGGRAHKISDSIYHLMRGYIYEIDGKRIFTLGGARSSDMKERIENNFGWWAAELPSQEELSFAEKTLENAGWQVDYIITHCAPDSVQDMINPAFKKDVLTNALEKINQQTVFEKWYFGHYHIDRRFEGKYYCMYNYLHLI